MNMPARTTDGIAPVLCGDNLVAHRGGFKGPLPLNPGSYISGLKFTMYFYFV
jgi:hypothetical protein